MPAADSSTYKCSPANDLSLNAYRATATNVSARTIFATAVGIVVILLVFSPNFGAMNSVRQTPYASDFLQEWTGGYIWASTYRAQLYRPEHSKAIQHDSTLVGFEWPANQYYPMVYPPFYYMLFSPISNVPYHLAAILWMLTLGAAAGFTIWVWARFHPAANRHWGKCLLGLVAFYPFLQSLNTAHKSIFLLLILTGSYLLLYHQKRFWAGLVFGLIAFKPHLGILIGIAMLAKGQWRFVAGCLLSVSGLIGLSLLAGVDLCIDYFWQCLAMGGYTNNSGYLLTQSHNFNGAIVLMFGSETMAANIAWWVCVCVTIGLLIAILRPHTQTDSPQFGLQYGSTIIATVLLSPHFYLYDLTIILLPIALIAFNMPAKNETLSKAMVGLCAAIFVASGLATNVAETTHIQPTIFLMVGLMVTLFIEIERSSSRVGEVGQFAVR